jgi:hypothetical protein
MINKVFYIFNFALLKQYIREHMKELRTVSTYDGSKGFALPIAAVIDIAKVVNF